MIAKSFFSDYTGNDENIITLIHEREMKMELLINKFRFSFVLLLSLITMFGFFAGKSKPIMLYFAIFNLLHICVIVNLLIRKFSSGNKYHSWVKYYATSTDLTLNFIMGSSIAFAHQIPVPISKHEILTFLSIFYIFFNILYILRSNKKVIVVSTILSIIFNLTVFIASGRFNMLPIFTSLFIGILGIFNIWISGNLIQNQIFNYKLNNANKALSEKNSEITQINEEVVAQRDEIENQHNEMLIQHNKILQQKIEIEHKNTSISDSIRYAQRIQVAILPKEETISEFFSEYFIFFKPRDVVSGDFYWFMKIDNTIMFAVGDCTGHGVPGAFVSMLGIAFLNEIVQHAYHLKTHEIINNLQKRINFSLQQTGDPNEINVGMDISLCAFDQHNKTLQFTGANIPVCIVKNNQIIEYKGNSVPIGIYFNIQNTFASNEIKLDGSEIVYLYTDGFKDQFGGAQNTKFFHKNFINLILEIHQNPMHIQKEILSETLINWQNGYEQIDDITVLGIKLI